MNELISEVLKKMIGGVGIDNVSEDSEGEQANAALGTKIFTEDGGLIEIVNGIFDTKM